MARYINLQLPSSCKESWNNMTPGQGGRYCLSCQKIVTDFTQMTDSELISYFTSRKESTCGRFTGSQLNRDIIIPKKQIPWIRYFFKFSLPAFLLSLKSPAEGQKVSAPMEISAVRSKAIVVDTTKDTSPVTGIVTDASGVPLPAAAVMIKGSSKGTMADEQGRFVLHNIDLPATLLISYVGYELIEIQLTSAQPREEITVKLVPLYQGEVVVVGYIMPKKVSKNKKEKNAPVARTNILAYPNPVIAGNRLSIRCQSLESGKYVAQLFNLSGQLVQVSNLIYDKKEGLLSLPIDETLSGTYMLELIHNSGKRISQQLVIRSH